MATAKQQLGDFGERVVASQITCPRCKRPERTLRTMPPNFKCADVICDFCGFLAQVKTKSVTRTEICPRTLLGAAWGPQADRMAAGIYFSLFVVAVDVGNPKAYSIFFLPAELQRPEMFKPRNKLSEAARRAGWQGFTIDFANAVGEPVKVL